MDSIAIIAEYNPFHKGHKKMIDVLRRRYGGSTAIIAVMSGSFVQRGEPALFGKWQRAAWSVACGIDCVVELPCAFVLNSAESFAAGGVRLAKAIGCTAVSCGMEQGTATDMKILAGAALASNLPNLLKAGRAKGMTYGEVLTHAIADTFPDKAALLQYPNTLLSLEYAKAIQCYAPELRFIPVHRSGSHTSQDITAYASASALRQAMTAGVPLKDYIHHIPPAMRIGLQKEWDNQAYTDYDRYHDIILYESRLLPAAELSHIAAFREGIENRWKKTLGNTGDWQHGMSNLKTRRYSYSRLRRMGAYTALGITQKNMDAWQAAGPQYARILALNDRGRDFVRTNRTTGSIPFINKITHSMNSLSSAGRAMLELDILATDIRQLCLVNAALRTLHEDYFQSPRMIHTK